MRAAESPINSRTLEAMNPNSSNSQTEMRWKTYAKAAAALIPAVAACLMARTFILPKVERIWAEAGLGPDGAIAAALVVLSNVGPALVFAAILFALVEWRWRSAARFRGALATSAVVVLNAAAFFGITALCVAAVLAAPNMHKRGGDPAAAPAVLQIGAPANP
jgi:hypothetical protein